MQGYINISLWCYSPPLNPNAAPHILVKDILSFEVRDTANEGRTFYLTFPRLSEEPTASLKGP